MPRPLSQILDRLRESGFRDIAGARITATIPIGEQLLNDIVASSLPRNGVVRELTIHPQPDNRLGVDVKVERPAFLPPISLTLVIDRQPEFPRSTSLVFRMMGLAGWLALASPLLPIDRMLPPGVHLEADRLTVDLAALLAHRGQAELLTYVERLLVRSERGRLLIDVQVSVPT